MSIFHGFVIFCLFAGTWGDSAVSQPPGVYSCPMVPALLEFDHTKFQGTWFKDGHFADPAEDPHACIVTNWTALANREFSVFTTASVKSARYYLGGRVSARPLNSSEPGQFKITLLNHYTVDYRILKTNYISYAVAHVCNNFPSTNGEFMLQRTSILTRQPHAPRAVIADAMKFISELGLNITNYTEHDQTNCENFILCR